MTLVTRNTTIRMDSVTRRPGTKYLDCMCIGTRVGVFLYIDPITGEQRREFRPPEEVFHPDSMASMANIPFTNDHPPVMLNSENTDQYQRGYLYGDVSKVDSKYLASRLLITHEGTIQDYDNGKRDVSMGYTCRLVFKSGVWNGQKYDAIQTEIRYNHVSLVKRGRAGPDCRVRTDQARAITVTVFDAIEMPEKNSPQGVKKPMADIRLDKDNVLQTDDDSLAVAVNSTIKALNSKYDTLKGNFDKLDGENTSLKRENTDLKAKADQFDKIDQRQLGKEWAQVEQKATPFLPDTFKIDEANSVIDLMRAAVESAHKADYKERSDEFIRGAFEGLNPPATPNTPSAAFIASQGNAAGRNDGSGTPAASVNQQRSDGLEDVGASAYQDMVEGK